MVDDVDKLVGEKAGIDGVADKAGARDAVIEFKMAEVVPGERSDTVRFAHAALLQGGAQLQGALAQFGVVGAVFSAACVDGNDLGIAMIQRCVIDN